MNCKLKTRTLPKIQYRQQAPATTDNLTTVFSSAIQRKLAMRKDGWSWVASHNRVPPMSLRLRNQITNVASKAVWPGPLRGALWMVLAAFSFAAMTTLIRKLSNEIHPFELAFFRSLFGLLFMLPWFLRAGFGALKTERLGLHGFRALVGLVAMLLWFLALSLMPIAEATALNFTAPLFATIGAAVFLGEKGRARRWGGNRGGLCWRFNHCSPGRF